MNTVITLSLISHTNVGKTTLARTLLRRDVGEVADQAHVTESSEAHVLIETPDAVLTLWDTPGFGDTRRLMHRLQREREPIGWLLHQVWDRVADRPLFCSQNAVHNIKDEADVVLYLVNASETPEHAGYVPLELELLTWMDRPVLLLLNQTADLADDLEPRWEELARRWAVVKGVLSLDAFSRCWVEEDVLLERVEALLPESKRQAMRGLADAWTERNLEVFRSSCRALARYVARAALDREPQGSRDAASGAFKILEDMTRVLKRNGVAGKRARAALNERLDRSTVELMERLIADHGLLGSSAKKIEQRVQDFQVKGRRPIDERSGALAGAVVSGALGGLAADALSGGLSLGGGMIAGGILGALGGSALARGYRLVAGDERPFVKWAPEFLDQLCRQVLLRYLAVAHYGRGRGRYEDLQQPAQWSATVEAALDRLQDDLRGLWKEAEKAGPEVSLHLQNSLERVFSAALGAVLLEAYPHAQQVLGTRSGL